MELGYLVVFRKGKPSAPYELESGEHTIGSSADCNIRLKFGHPLLLETHAVIRVGENGVATIINQSSEAPVKVNTKTTLRPTILKHEDKFEILGKVFQYFNEKLKNEQENDEKFQKERRNILSKHRQSVNPLPKTPAKKSPILKTKTSSIRKTSSAVKSVPRSNSDFHVFITPNKKNDSHVGSKTISRIIVSKALVSPKRKKRLSLDNVDKASDSPKISSRNVLLSKSTINITISEEHEYSDITPSTKMETVFKKENINEDTGKPNEKSRKSIKALKDFDVSDKNQSLALIDLATPVKKVPASSSASSAKKRHIDRWSILDENSDSNHGQIKTPVNKRIQSLQLSRHSVKKDTPPPRLSLSRISSRSSTPLGKKILRRQSKLPSNDKDQEDLLVTFSPNAEPSCENVTPKETTKKSIAGKSEENNTSWSKSRLSFAIEAPTQGSLLDIGAETDLEQLCEENDEVSSSFTKLRRSSLRKSDFNRSVAGKEENTSSNLNLSRLSLKRKKSIQNEELEQTLGSSKKRTSTNYLNSTQKLEESATIVKTSPNDAENLSGTPIVGRKSTQGILHPGSSEKLMDIEEQNSHMSFRRSSRNIVRTFSTERSDGEKCGNRYSRSSKSASRPSKTPQDISVVADGELANPVEQVMNEAIEKSEDTTGALSKDNSSSEEMEPLFIDSSGNSCDDAKLELFEDATTENTGRSSRSILKLECSPQREISPRKSRDASAFCRVSELSPVQTVPISPRKSRQSRNTSRLNESGIDKDLSRTSTRKSRGVVDSPNNLNLKVEVDANNSSTESKSIKLEQSLIMNNSSNVDSSNANVSNRSLNNTGKSSRNTSRISTRTHNTHSSVDSAETTVENKLIDLDTSSRSTRKKSRSKLNIFDESTQEAPSNTPNVSKSEQETTRVFDESTYEPEFKKNDSMRRDSKFDETQALSPLRKSRQPQNISQSTVENKVINPNTSSRSTRNKSRSKLNIFDESTQEAPSNTPNVSKSEQETTRVFDESTKEPEFKKSNSMRRDSKFDETQVLSSPKKSRQPQNISQRTVENKLIDPNTSSRSTRNKSRSKLNIFDESTQEAPSNTPIVSKSEQETTRVFDEFTNEPEFKKSNSMRRDSKFEETQDLSSLRKSRQPQNISQRTVENKLIDPNTSSRSTRNKSRSKLNIFDESTQEAPSNKLNVSKFEQETTRVFDESTKEPEFKKSNSMKRDSKFDETKVLSSLRKSRHSQNTSLSTDKNLPKISIGKSRASIDSLSNVDSEVEVDADNSSRESNNKSKKSIKMEQSVISLITSDVSNAEESLDESISNRNSSKTAKSSRISTRTLNTQSTIDSAETTVEVNQSSRSTRKKSQSKLSNFDESSQEASSNKPKLDKSGQENSIFDESTIETLPELEKSDSVKRNSKLYETRELLSPVEPISRRKSRKSIQDEKLESPVNQDVSLRSKSRTKNQSSNSSLTVNSLDQSSSSVISVSSQSFSSFKQGSIRKESFQNETELIDVVNISSTLETPEKKVDFSNVKMEKSEDKRTRSSKRVTRTSELFRDVSCTSTPFHKQKKDRPAYESTVESTQNLSDSKQLEVFTLSSDSQSNMSVAKRSRSISNLHENSQTKRRRSSSRSSVSKFTTEHNCISCRDSRNDRTLNTSRTNIKRISTSAKKSSSKVLDSSNEETVGRVSEALKNCTPPLLHRKSIASSLIEVTPAKAEDLEEETPKSSIKPTRRSSKANQSAYNPVLEDITPVTPEKLNVSGFTEETFKTPINTPALFESIRKSAIRSRKRLRESNGSSMEDCKRARVDFDQKQDPGLLATPKEIQSPKNDLRNIPNLRKFVSPRTQKSPKNDLTNVAGVKKMLSTPKEVKSPKNDLRNIPNLRRLVSPRTQNSPKNDLTNLAGVKKLLSTPKEVKSPKNDLRNVPNLRRLVSPRTQNSPKNDLTNVAGVKKLLSTPKEVKSPKNDLRNVPNLRRLVSPRTQNSPKNDLTNVAGVKKLLSTPKEVKSPKNDLRNTPNLRRLVSPRTQNSPKNDLTNVAGIKQLLKTPRTKKEPRNDLTNVSGVSNIFNVSGVDILHEEGDLENSEDVFTKLSGKQPIRAYSRGKSFSPQNKVERETTQSRKTMGDIPDCPPRVRQWVEEHANIAYETMKEVEGMTEQEPLSSNVSEKHGRLSESHQTISPKRTSKEFKNRTNSHRGASEDENTSIIINTPVRTEVLSAKPLDFSDKKQKQPTHKSEDSNKFLEVGKPTRRGRRVMSAEDLDVFSPIIASPHQGDSDKKLSVDKSDQKVTVEGKGSKNDAKTELETKIADEPEIKKSTRSRSKKNAIKDIQDTPDFTSSPSKRVGRRGKKVEIVEPVPIIESSVEVLDKIEIENQPPRSRRGKKVVKELTNQSEKPLQDEVENVPSRSKRGKKANPEPTNQSQKPIEENDKEIKQIVSKTRRGKQKIEDNEKDKADPEFKDNKDIQEPTIEDAVEKQPSRSRRGKKVGENIELINQLEKPNDEKEEAVKQVVYRTRSGKQKRENTDQEKAVTEFKEDENVQRNAVETSQDEVQKTSRGAKNKKVTEMTEITNSLEHAVSDNREQVVELVSKGRRGRKKLEVVASPIIKDTKKGSIKNEDLESSSKNEDKEDPITVVKAPRRGRGKKQEINKQEGEQVDAPVEPKKITRGRRNKVEIQEGEEEPSKKPVRGKKGVEKLSEDQEKSPKKPNTRKPRNKVVEEIIEMDIDSPRTARAKRGVNKKYSTEEYEVPHNTVQLKRKVHFTDTVKTPEPETRKSKRTKK